MRPDDLTGFLIETVDFPGVRHAIARKINASILCYESDFTVAADRCDNVDSISPNNWTGVRETRNRSFPNDVLGVVNTPRAGSLFTLCNSGSIVAAKRRPVLTAGGGYKSETENKSNSKRFHERIIADPDRHVC